MEAFDCKPPGKKQKKPELILFFSLKPFGGLYQIKKRWKFYSGLWRQELGTPYDIVNPWFKWKREGGKASAVVPLVFPSP